MAIRRHTKSNLKTGSSFAALSIALALSGHASAGGLPTHGHYVSGQGSISKGNQSLTVKQSSTTGIIDWNSFSVGNKSGVTFDNGSGATLNRVTGGNLSTIAGSLHATGSLYLMNSAGVIVSGTGHIVTGGSFVASSGNIANSAFGDGDRRFKPGTGDVVNRGTIVSGGSASLLGRNVSDSGTIHASSVDLSATDTLAVSGSITAHNSNGSGGAVTARAGTIVIGTDGNIDASASGSGQKGGTISVVSRGTTTVAGSLAAKGGLNGSGGFIETSGEHVHVSDSAKISTLAANGKTGTWLIDPQDFTIAASGGDITGAALSAELASNDVDIKSSAGATSGHGDIFVDDAVSWSSGQTLTLDAYRNIDVNAPIAISGAGVLALAYGDHAQHGGGNAANGDLIFGSGNIAFTNVASGTDTQLEINSQAYTLENTIADLANGMSANGNGFYALANNYDASGGAAYSASPILTAFSGTFEGLGNSISNLRIVDNAGGNIGLFGETDGATLRDIALDNVSIIALKNVDNNNIGGLVGLANNTAIDHASVSGTMIIGSAAINNDSAVGGLAGDWTLVASTATDVSSDVSIFAGANARAGSLAGLIEGTGSNTLTDSHAGGDVIVGIDGSAGGFAGQINNISVTGSSATGMVSGAGGGDAGGFAGAFSGTASDDYATGDVFEGQGNNSDAGGFAGEASASLDHSWASGNVQTAGAQGGAEIISGGFVGFLESGSVANSFATGDVTSGNTSGNMLQGGFVGFMESGTISDSYATGTVTGNAVGAAVGGELYGGFAGYIRGAISKSYETGAVIVSGPAKVGGFVGQADSAATVDESYEFGKVTVDATAFGVGGFAGDNENTSGIGATVADYYNKTANTFGGVGNDVAPSSSDVGGISASSMFKKKSYAGWSFGKSTKGSGWVIVDSDGTFNNAGSAAGGTLPMLLSEYSTTITNAHQLQLAGLNLSANYTLGNTIDASGTAGGDVWGSHGFVHIGYHNSKQNVWVAYSGTFDGAGNAVVGLTETNMPDAYGGLFVALASGGTVENLGLVNVSIDNSSLGGGSDGAIAAAFSEGALINDYTTGQVLAGGGGAAGGLVGTNEGGGFISHSWSSATVSGTAGTEVGGLAGSNNGGADITTSYATGNVTVTVGDSSFAGGLVGNNDGGTIDTSYSSGTVKGASGTIVGAFAGANTGSIGLSYFDKTKNGSTPGVESGSHVGVTGLTAAQTMHSGSFAHWTFGTLGSGADWVIVDADGSLNNANHVNGGTMPMLLGEYSTTINTSHQLQLMELDPAANYTLANDIDASGTAGGDVWGSHGFVAVGGDNSSGDFAGAFDGAGYTIGGLTINDVTNVDVGLFGLTDRSADISNVTLSDVSVRSTASTGTGGLVGANTATIFDVSVSGAVSGAGIVSDAASVGGLAGYSDGFIMYSHSSAAVAATRDGSGAGAGGLVGFATVDSDIEDSFATGAVSMEGDLVGAGGLVGINGGRISQSFASGAVTLTDPTTTSGNTVGGLVGTNDGGAISQSYSLGNVKASGGATASVGGFVGGNSGLISQSFSLGSATGASVGGFAGEEDSTDGGNISNSYWDKQTSGLTIGVGSVVGDNPKSLTGRTTSQLEAALPSGFSSAAWSIVAGSSLPYLNWQFISGAPQVVSGILQGVAGAGVADGIVSLLQDGENLDSVLTGGSVESYANGFYYFLLSPGSIDTSPASGLIAYDTALHAAVFDDQASGSATDLDLKKNYLREETAQATLSAVRSDLTHALGGDSTVTALLGAIPNLEIDSAGGFDLDRAIDQTGTVVIDAASGAVNQSAALTASNLLLEGNANFTLDVKSNSFSTIAMKGRGGLSVKDHHALTIGTVGNVNGVDAGGGVVLTTAGDLIIAQLLEAKNHDMTLTSGGTITEQKTAEIKALALSGLSNGTVKLTSVHNVITDLGNFTTHGNDFALTDNHNLTVDGTVNARLHAISLTTVGTRHNLLIASALTASTINLKVTGRAKENSSGAIVADKLNVKAGTGIVLTSSMNKIKKIGRDKTTSGPNKITK